MARDGSSKGGSGHQVEETWKNSQRAADIARHLERQAPAEPKTESSEDE